MSWSMPQLRLRWSPSKRILVFSRCISTRGRRWIAHYELNTWEMISSTQIYAKFACKSSVAHHCWRWYLAIDDAEDRFSNQGVYDEKIQEFQQNVRRDCPLYKQQWLTAPSHPILMVECQMARLNFRDVLTNTQLLPSPECYWLANGTR